MILHTQRNRVITEEPEPDDAFFFITLLGPAFGEDLFNPRVLSPSRLPLRPITEYQQGLDWALSVAYQFERPIYVCPMSANQFLNNCKKVFSHESE